MNSLFLLLTPLVALSAAEANLSRPNIVIFLVDDMGVMDTSVPFLTDESGQAEAVSAERLLPHAEHGAAGGAGNPLQQLLRHERLLAHAHLDHDRAERRAASHDQLDQSRQGQPRSLRSAAMELEGLDEGRRDVAAAAAGEPAIARSTSAKATSDRARLKVPSRRTSASTSTSPVVPLGHRPATTARQNYGHGQQAVVQRRSAPGEVPRHRDLSDRGADDRGQVARHRRGEGRQALLPLSLRTTPCMRRSTPIRVSPPTTRTPANRLPPRPSPP